MKISVAGLGKLGAAMAAVFADRGFAVTGVDIRPEIVDLIQAGLAPVCEPGLADLITRNRRRLRATTDLEGAVLATDATFVIVPTPSGDDGKFSLRHMMPAVSAIARALRKKSSYHLVVISSTVMPGSLDGVIVPELTRISGKRLGRDFGVCYHPEFIALGSVIHDLQHPDMVLIGESDARAGSVLEGIYRRMVDGAPPFARMNFVNAELTKLSVNAYVTTKISYANMLAEICERIEEADVDVITSAMGFDNRIGPRYLKGGMGYGGPCFPRDNVAFDAMARTLGAEATLVRATHCVNQAQVTRLSSLILDLMPENTSVAGILGLSYKPATGVIEESHAMAIAQTLLDAGIHLAVYDPEAMENAARVLCGPVEYCGSMLECAAQSRFLALLTPWPEFAALRPEHLDSRHGKPVVLDCWRMLSREVFEDAVCYVRLGQGPAANRYAGLTQVRSA